MTFLIVAGFALTYFLINTNSKRHYKVNFCFELVPAEKFNHPVLNMKAFRLPMILEAKLNHTPTRDSEYYTLDFIPKHFFKGHQDPRQNTILMLETKRIVFIENKFTIIGQEIPIQGKTLEEFEKNSQEFCKNNMIGWRVKMPISQVLD